MEGYMFETDPIVRYFLTYIAVPWNSTICIRKFFIKIVITDRADRGPIVNSGVILMVVSFKSSHK